MQYTIRGVPDAVDEALRARARAEGRSLNDVAVEALADGLGLGETDVVRRDLSDIVGTWKRDAAVDAALAAQDRVDAELWE
jgi:plasmid stability protein